MLAGQQAHHAGAEMAWEPVVSPAGDVHCADQGSHYTSRQFQLLRGDTRSGQRV